jgi:hypothetical protein
MDRPTPAENERVRALAQSLDCFTEEDVNLLTDTTPGTTESWRKRGKGPAYVLIGNRYLYPRAGMQEFLSLNVRARQPLPRKALL